QPSDVNSSTTTTGCGCIAAIARTIGIMVRVRRRPKPRDVIAIRCYVVGMTRSPAVLVAAVAALVVASSAHAAVCMDHEAVLPNPADITKSVKQTLQSCQQGKRYKRDSPLRNETVIIDLEKGEVYGVNGAKRTYWKMKADKYQQLAVVSLVVMGVQVDPRSG